MRVQFFLAVVFLSGMLSACKKSFLEQANPNAVAVDAGYQTEADIATGVYGVYQALRSSNCIGEGAQLWTDDRADDVNTTDNQSNNGEPFQFSAFSLVPSNSYLLNHWNALYTPITRANTILSSMDAISFSSEDTKQQYIAELKFIRAYMYFNLVKEFGDVPLVTERVSTLEQANALTFREKKEKVYDQIVADLTEVTASHLPVMQSEGKKGMASLQAANALLGLVYLTMGTSLDEADAPENFNYAKTYLLACYQQKTFGLLSDIPFADVFDINKKTTNPEIIWQIAYKQGDPNYSSALAKNNQAKGETINSPFASQGSGGLFSKDLFNEFEAGDVRTDFSIKYADATSNYFITKFRDPSPAATIQGYGGNDWIVIRYADVILNLAEAYLYLGDHDNAIQYLDMVRARAGMPDYATMQEDPDYTSRYPTLKLAILHERRVELAFEHHRWQDLTRFFNPEELVDYFKSKDQADFDNSPLDNIGTKDYYFPIPLTEVNLNPETMYQNPGY